MTEIGEEMRFKTVKTESFKLSKLDGDDLNSGLDG